MNQLIAECEYLNILYYKIHTYNVPVNITVNNNIKIAAYVKKICQFFYAYVRVLKVY